ncbi:MAG: winged helix DNA-binding domain-containing protein [Microbacterium gubbeenense]|uniref:winged helix DNA-binding domain-containing protein n=2 Tax=Microbacterium gubbeenense TaxID=159896 RepID=UPI003F9AE4A2
MRSFTAVEARRARWANQLLGGSDLTPTEVVDRAVALQGQDLPAVLRAIAIRSRPGTTVDDVRAAFDRGELVRSWPMRGTLFATTPAHLTNLLSLTAERIHRSTTKRRAELGLDTATINRAREVLAPHGALTRTEVLALWTEAGLAPSGGRGYHLIFHHAVAGHWHWAAFRGKAQLLTVTERGRADADPLPEIVRRIVAARGPMTESDIAWWLKLPKTQVRPALNGLTEVSVEGVRAWVAGEIPDPGDTRVTLVPAFDEWILGYENRDLTAPPAMMRALVPGKNGVFRPPVLVDGTTVGTWQQRTASRREPSFELTEKVNAATRKRIEAAVAAWPHE